MGGVVEGGLVGMDADKLFGFAFDVHRCPLKGHNKCQNGGKDMRLQRTQIKNV